MIAAFSGQAKPMRVSTAGSGGSDERMFTVISQGLQSGRQRQTGRTYFVSYSRLEATLRLITAGGGHVVSVTPRLKHQQHQALPNPLLQRQLHRKPPHRKPL